MEAGAGGAVLTDAAQATPAWLTCVLRPGVRASPEDEPAEVAGCGAPARTP
jgi:hypothetical protein